MMCNQIRFMAACFALVASPVFAVPFTNGDFSSGSTGWNDASSTGTASVVSGQAQLDTGAGTDLFSAVLVQGDDGFFNFSNPISLDASVNYLNFDVAFVDLGVDGSESGGSFFTDALFVYLYDALDFSKDLFIDPLVDISFGSTLTRLHFDVSSLAGRDVALSFELADENDGRNSRVLIDNITFTSTINGNVSVPEPPMVLLIATGLVGLIGIKGRKRQH